MLFCESVEEASLMSPKSALVFLAEGAEEMEVVIIVDTLRRAKVGKNVGTTTELRGSSCFSDVISVQPNRPGHVCASFRKT